MRYFILVIITLFAIVLVSCAPQSSPVGVKLVADNPAPTFTPNIIIVTPTVAPTQIPTIELITPSMTPSPTPTATFTPDSAMVQAICQDQLNALYQSASELCLGKPSGYFCNGGNAPIVEPQGAIANSFGTTGAVVEAGFIDVVHSQALLKDNSGGIVYLHMRDDVVMNALLIGDVEMRNTTPQGFPKWKNFTVKTNTTTMPCANVPPSSFVVQGLYGQPSSVVINGVSVDLNGTLMVQTSAQIAHFIALEGIVRVTVLGNSKSLYAGQQLDVMYGDETFSSPSAFPSDPVPLQWELIEHLPVVMMERPVLLPQPGYLETTGNVNMRTAPDTGAQLIYQVPAGEIVSVLGKNTAGDWYHVRLGNDETGWMKADLLRGNINEVAVVYDATPQPPQRFGKLGYSGLVASAQGGNLRTAPDTYFNTITTLKQGTEVELLARSPYSPWVKVRAEGQEGWVALITLETQSVIQFLPVDYNVSLPPVPTSTPVFQFGGGHAYPDPNGGR